MKIIVALIFLVCGVNANAQVAANEELKKLVSPDRGALHGRRLES